MDEIMLQILGELKDIKAGQITMQGDIDGVRADLAEVKEDVAVLKEDVAVLKGDMIEVKRRVTNVEKRVEDMDLRLSTVAVVQENDVARKIGLLIDGHVGLVEKLDRLEDVPEQIEDIRSALRLQRAVITEHIRG